MPRRGHSQPEADSEPEHRDIESFAGEHHDLYVMTRMPRPAAPSHTNTEWYSQLYPAPRPATEHRDSRIKFSQPEPGEHLYATVMNSEAESRARADSEL
jgi:hypothetical protein